jgi:hypothetical protein
LIVRFGASVRTGVRVLITVRVIVIIAITTTTVVIIVIAKTKVVTSMCVVVWWALSVIESVSRIVCCEVNVRSIYMRSQKKIQKENSKRKVTNKIESLSVQQEISKSISRGLSVSEQTTT